MRSAWLASALSLFLAAFAGPLLSASSDDAEAKARRAIEAFLEDPLGADGAVRRAFLDFAEADENVTILIDDKVITWMNDKHEGESSLLLGAYIAGSLRAQLESRVWRDDPYCGWLQTLRVYRALKESDPKLSIDELESLAKKHATGKLAEAAAEVEAARAAASKEK